MNIDLKTILLLYLILTGMFTAFRIIYMNLVNHKANAKKYGRERMLKLQREGRLRQIPLYGMEEIAKHKSLGDVRLSVFPADTQDRTHYVIICPGGGYSHLCTEKEGYPIAAKFNEKGYTAFVLEYRVRFHCHGYAPMQDLNQAIRHIEANAEQYNVYKEGYAICGFSAGGNLAGMYGTHEYGYEKYHTSKPATLILGYPWTNINHWLAHPYWNIWIGLIGLWFTERGNLFMFGIHANAQRKESLSVQRWIREDYPPTYIFAGGDDVLVPSSHHADTMAETLENNGVPYRYEQFFHVPHGIGLGVGTRAAGWFDHAVTFWEEHR